MPFNSGAQLLGSPHDEALKLLALPAIGAMFEQMSLSGAISGLVMYN